MTFDLERFNELLTRIPITVEGMPEPINVGFYPSKLTAGMIKQLEDADGQTFLPMLEDALIAILGEWDITKGTDENGQPVAYDLTPANVRALPNFLKGRLFGFIKGFLYPPTPRPTSSSVTSEAAESLATSRIGGSSAH